MADIADNSDNDIELNIINQRKALDLRPQYEATGACLNCGTALKADHRWCDEDCRDDFLDTFKRGRA